MMRQKVGNLFEVEEEMHVANNIYMFFLVAYSLLKNCSDCISFNDTYKYRCIISFEHITLQCHLWKNLGNRVVYMLQILQLFVQ